MSARQQKQSYAPTRHVTSLNPGDFPTYAYQALTDIPCTGCQATIPAGTLFSRHKKAKGDTTKLPADHWKIKAKPYCRKCWPFRIEYTEED